MPSKKVETPNNQFISAACRTLWRASIERKFSGRIKRSIIASFAVLILVLSGVSPAFSQSITDFAIFGDTDVVIGGTLGTDTVPTGPIGTNGDMDLGTFIFTTDVSGSGNLIFGGTGNNIVEDVIFNGDVTFGVNVTVLGNVDAGGKVDFGGTSTIGGSITAGTDFETGTDVLVTNNVDAGGDGFFGPNPQLIGGNLTLGGIIASGSPLVNGTTTLNGGPPPPAPPVPYIPIPVPGATPFTAGGADITKGANQTTSLAPGIYGTLSLGGSNTLELTSPGSYFFDAWSLGTNLDLKMDLDDGPYLIFIVGNVGIQGGLDIFDLSSDTQLDPANPANAALAENFFLEVGGLDFDIGVNCDWFGTVFVPDGNLNFGGTARIAGALYAGNQNGDAFGGVVDMGVNILMNPVVASSRILTVVKSLPLGDPGLFVMNANGTDGLEGGNGASASEFVDVGATANFSETAGTGTSLADYTTTWSCDNGNSGTGTSDSLTMPAENVTCTFTNTPTGTTERVLTVQKSLVPLNDPGLFVMNADGTNGTQAGNGATASESVTIGATANFGEAAGTGTSLANYTTTWLCDNGNSGMGTSGMLVMPDVNVICTITNERTIRTLTVVKDLLPSNDPGLFVMDANGMTGTEGGDGASASDPTVPVGVTASFSETAGTGTSLADYNTAWSCSDGSSGNGPSATLTMPDMDVTCTFTNTNNAISPIPTLSEWGLMLLAGLLGLFMVVPGLRRC